MSDYTHAKVENIQNLIENWLKKQKKKLNAEFIQKLKDLPIWSSINNVFVVNQEFINKLIEEYEAK